MALKNERERRICAKYSAVDSFGNVHCCDCPLNYMHFKSDMPEMTCKAFMTWDRHKREWVQDMNLDALDHKCPYCKNGRCSACKVLSIECDGRMYFACQQYQDVSAERNDEE